MPQTDTSAYEYQPEEKVTSAQFYQLMNAIKDADLLVNEDVSFVHVDCQSGACPVDFRV